MKLADYLSPELTLTLDLDSRDASLREMCARIAATDGSIDPEGLFAALLEREGQSSTATPEGVAFPHATLEGASRTLVAAAKLSGRVAFDGAKGRRADLIFLLVGPPDTAWEHLRLLGRLARICHEPGVLHRFRAAESGGALYRSLVEEDARHV